jgi:hypothetical protein
LSLSDADLSALLSPDAPSVRVMHQAHTPATGNTQTKRRLVNDATPQADEASKPVGRESDKPLPHQTAAAAAAAQTHASDYRTPIANEIARALIPIGVRENIAKPRTKTAWTLVHTPCASRALYTSASAVALVVPRACSRSCVAVARRVCGSVPLNASYFIPRAV